MLFPLMVPAVKRLYTVRPDAIARAKERFREAIVRFDRALEARRYLGGDAPNRVDITVAALLGPCCRPPEHLVRWPDVPELDEFFDEFASSRTFEHTRFMYRAHRNVHQPIAI